MATSTSNAALILTITGAAPVPLKRGEKTILSAKAGQRYRVVKEEAPADAKDTVAQDAANKASTAKDVAASQHGQDLLLSYADGTQVVLSNFYEACKAEQCAVDMPGSKGSGASGGYVITGDSPVGAGLANGGRLIYAFGDVPSLSALTQGAVHASGWSVQDTVGTYVAPQAAAFSVPLALGAFAGAVALLQQSSKDTTAPTLKITSDAHTLQAGETATITFSFSEDPGASFVWDGTSGDVIVTGGTLSAITGSGLTRTATFTPEPGIKEGNASITVAAGSYSDAAGNAGGAGSTPAISLDTFEPTIIHGGVVAGPVIEGNGLQVVAYKQNGQELEGGSGSLNADGSFTLTITEYYTGAILLRVVDSSSGVDYFDEGTGAAKDLTSDLRAVTTLPEPGTYTVNINALTELAVRKLGLGSGDAGTSATALGNITATDVQSANQQVADAVGLTQDLVTGSSPVAVITTEGQTNEAANAYGQLLAAISGAEVGAGSTDVLDTLLVSLQDSAQEGGLSTAGVEILVRGAAAVAAIDPTLVTLVSDLTKQSTVVGIDQVAVDNFVSAAEKAAGVEVTGTAGANAQVQVAWGQHTQTDTANDQGQWRVRFTSAEIPEDGASSIIATQGSQTALRGVYVVTALPAVPGLELSQDTGSSSTDGISQQGAVTVTGLASDTTWEYSTNAGLTWTAGSNASFTLGEGSYAAGQVQVRQADRLGNTSTAGSNANTIAIDTLAPTVTITSNQSALKAGETATITFTFSEDPGASFAWNGTSGDVVVSGGTLGAISGSGLTRTATFTPTANLASGNASITVTAAAYMDAAGNSGGAGSTPSVSMDTLAPQAPTLALTTDSGASNTDGITNVSRIDISGVEAGATWQYSTDSGANWSDGANQVAMLPAGSYSAGQVQVRQTDAAGNTSAVGSNTAAITIDHTKPASLSLSLDSDTGTDTSDAVTQDGTITISNPEALATWQFSTDGGVTWSTGSGTSFTLQEGSYAAGQVKVRQTDVAGNVSLVGTNTSAIMVDTTAPSDLTLALATDSGSNTQDGLSNTATVNVSGLDTDTTWQYSLDNGQSWNDGTDNSFELGEGSQTVQVRQTDAAGNTSTSASSLLTLDSTAPTTLSTTPISPKFAAPTSNLVMQFDEAVSKGTGYIRIVNDTDAVEIQIDINSSEVVVDGDTVTINPSADLQLAHNYHITVDAGALVDAAGNDFAGISDASTWSFEVPDPAVSLDTVATDNRINAAEKTAGTVSLSGVLTSSNSSILTQFGAADFTVMLTAADGDVLTATVSSYDSSTGAWTATADASGLTEQSYAVSVSADNGTYSTSASSKISVDTSVATPQITLAKDSGVDNSDAITRTGGVNVSGLENGATWEYSTDAGANWIAGTGSSIEISTDGVYSLQVRQTDAAGNTSEAATLGFTLDTQAPTLAITSDVATLKAGETATITFTFSEDPGSSFAWSGSTGDVVVTGGTLGEISGSGLTRTATFTPTANLASGSASITVTAAAYSDTAGNSGGAGATPAISIDTLAPVAPTLALAADTGASSSDGLTSNDQVNVTRLDTTATWEYSTDAGATWNTGGGTSFTLAEGSYSAGQIKVRQTDLAGNTSTSSSNTGAIELDSMAPTVTIESDSTTLQADEQATIYFTLSEPSANFDATSIQVSGGTLDELVEVDDGVYGAFFTPDADSTTGASIRVASGAFADQAGNSNADGSEDDNNVFIEVDTVRPVARSLEVNQDGQIVLTFSANLDTPSGSDLSTFASRFDIRVNGVAKTIQSVQVVGQTLTLTFNEALGAGELSVSYTDPDTSSNNQNVVQSVNGNDADGFTLGVVADGYVSGAQIYIDTNANGMADPSELQAGVVTSSKGTFLLPRTAPAGVIISMGGTNIDTGLPQTTPLKAPAGSRTINPLTTLVQSVIYEASAALPAQTLTPS